jgi:uncharacterized protein (TIGR00251 family)
MRPGRGGDGVTGDVLIRLQPRARRTEVVGERGDRIVVRVTAPPVAGRANDALRALVAERAGVPAGRVAIVRGHTARDKTVRVDGVPADALRRALLVQA